MGNRQKYALKRLIVADRDTQKKTDLEIRLMQSLARTCPTIVSLIDVVQISARQSGHSNGEALLLMEFCSGGTLVDVMNQVGFDKKFSPAQIAKIFTEVARAMVQLHNNDPPVIHRDLKIENLLVANDGTVKLCDFGSATLDVMNPKSTREIAMAEDEIQLNTTAQYRAPEMVDFYSYIPVTEKSDIWALGVLLYKLCYFVTPFEDGSKNAIANANFRFPNPERSPGAEKYTVFSDLIRVLLTKDPRDRPSATEVLDEIEKLGERIGERPEPLIRVRQPAPSHSAHNSSDSGYPGGSMYQQGDASSQSRQSGRRKSANSIRDVTEKSKSFFRSVVAGSTNKVAGDLDLSVILPRLIAMSFPGEGMEATYRNDINAVKAFLDGEYGAGSYMVFNLTKRVYDRSLFSNNVVDLSWPENEPPSLDSLYLACQSIHEFLISNDRHVVAVHCMSGKVATATLIAAYMTYCGHSSTNAAFKLFCDHRFSKSSGARSITPSQFRYVNYISGMVNRKLTWHPMGVKFNSLTLHGCPMVDVMKAGCRPFVVFSKHGKTLYSSAPPNNPDMIKSFKADVDSVVQVPLTNAMVYGDVCITVYHAHVLFGKLKASVMFRIYLNTGCLIGKPGGRPGVVKFPVSALDGVSLKPNSGYPQNFMCEISYDISSKDCGGTYGFPWDDTSKIPDVGDPKVNSICYFSDSEEYRERVRASRTQPPVFSRDNAPRPPASGFASVPKSPSVENISRPGLNEDGNKKQQRPASGGSSGKPVRAADLFDWHGGGSTGPSETSGGASQKNSAPAPKPNLPNRNTSGAGSPLIDVFADANTNESSQGSLSGRNSPLLGKQTADASSNDPFGLFSGSGSSDMKTNTGGTVSRDSPIDVFSADFNSPPVVVGNSGPSSNANIDDILSSDLDSKMGMGEGSGAQTDFFAAEPLMPTSTKTSANQKGSSYKPMNPSLGGRKSPAVGVAGDKNSDPFTNLGDFGLGGSNNNSNNSPRNSLNAQRATAASAPNINRQTSSNAPTQSSNFSGSKPNYNVYVGRASNIGATSSSSQQSHTRASSGPRTSGTASSSNLRVNNRGFSPSVSPLGSPGRPSSPSPGPSGQGGNPDFSDLLGAHNFKPSEPSKPTTINDLKMEQMEGEDPDSAVKMKVENWEAGKKGNIRALLSSLQHILWDDAEWEDVSIANLVKPIQVKKAYMRACRLVHPDKVEPGSEHEELARCIFISLNDAFNSFKENGSLPLV
eukprot:Nk52_evm5s208 gene=Nk52_evmTU5s208